MTVPNHPIKYSDIRLGAPGGCLDYCYLGCCKDPSCTYNHMPTGPVQDSKAKKVAEHLKKAGDAYTAAQSS